MSVAAGGEVAHLWRRVCALGVAQIVSWGTLFYTIAVLGSGMRADTGVSELWLYASYTVGLFASGMVSPAIGREIDSHGGRRVLSAGSVLAGAACVLLACAQGPITVLAGWTLAGIGMGCTLYDPAFATLHQLAGRSYRHAVTALTLFGGFASTVFWPLSQWILDAYGWRAAYVTYAVLHLALCLPIHLAFVPRGRHAGVAPPEPVATTASPRSAVFLWLATALSLVAFIASAVTSHLVGLLTATGLTSRDAVLVGSLIGPMQVAGRVMEFAFARQVKAIVVGTFAFALMAVSLAIFTQIRGVWIVALAFAIAYGWANGVLTIVRGTVPAELFGQRGYGALLGRLALPQFVTKAVAPFALALMLTVDPSRMWATWALLALGVGACVAYRAAVTKTGSGQYDDK